MKTLGVIAIAVLAALLVREVFPKRVQVTEIVRLPSQTVYDTVTETVVDSITRTVFRDRPVFNTDTIVLRDTVWRSLPDTVSALPFTWYLTRLKAGHRLDTPSYVVGEGLQYNRALTRTQTFERYPVTLGPVEEVWTDAAGIHVKFGEWPPEPQTCGTWCVAKWTLGAVAAGVIVGSVF